ncbi:uncharacterized protein MELLADRAFT_101220 [Melampsora larici-populina 98AG31]|uniref:Uncharacterized protein n=1 Tax=Melampsora larici-populina (strain 98AG31 / pathotype 3-4-7) TaxID=747676 RepID=F4R412_MELLP|nr:uncharacterized protein MELLADRAFT_101220 [Melampsora larici-populina 98AG31]EGG13071.1 hypothetical protein MELLADRAFT_101220 [Melampsora larici-populina 98AG31]
MYQYYSELYQWSVLQGVKSNGMSQSSIGHVILTSSQDLPSGVTNIHFAHIKEMSLSHDCLQQLRNPAVIAGFSGDHRIMEVTVGLTHLDYLACVPIHILAKILHYLSPQKMNVVGQWTEEVAVGISNK